MSSTTTAAALPPTPRPAEPTTRDRTHALLDALREAGLAGKVQIGVPAPPTGTPGPSRSNSPRANPHPHRAGETSWTEEGAFPPDDLLRPLSSAGTGRLIELAGQVSSGRTSLAYRMAAGATAKGELVGWIDLPNALDPRSVLRSGVDLRRVLWVRPPEVRAALRAAELLLKTGFALVTLDLEGTRAQELARMQTSVWTRLLRAVRASRATALVLSPTRLARPADPTVGSTATLALETARQRARFERGLFEGLDAHARVTRDRHGPPGAECAFSVHHRA